MTKHKESKDYKVGVYAGVIIGTKTTKSETPGFCRYDPKLNSIINHQNRVADTMNCVSRSLLMIRRFS